VLSRYSAAALFDSRLFTGFAIFCCLPFILGAISIYVLHSSMVQALLGMRLSGSEVVNNIWFWVFLQIECWMAFFMTVWSVPGIMMKDLANNALQLYLSRPLSRTEYLLGKISAVMLLLSAITWFPGLLLFGLQAQLEGHGWGGEHLWLMGAIFMGCLLWISVMALLALALSVWVKWRIAASGLMFAAFFVLAGLGQVIDSILRTQWGRLLNIPYVMALIWAHLFRLPSSFVREFRYARVPLWSAWASIISICLICLMLLNRRLKAREVERG
jgi:ABC-2 type transport system permease protein